MSTLLWIHKLQLIVHLQQLMWASSVNTHRLVLFTFCMHICKICNSYACSSTVKESKKKDEGDDEDDGLDAAAATAKSREQMKRTFDGESEEEEEEEEKEEVWFYVYSVCRCFREIDFIL